MVCAVEMSCALHQLINSGEQSSHRVSLSRREIRKGPRKKIGERAHTYTADCPDARGVQELNKLTLRIPNFSDHSRIFGLLRNV